MSDLTIPCALIDSRRWRALTPAARAIYIELALADLGDGKPIALTHREATFICKCSIGAVARGFQALVDAGFVIRTPGHQRFASKWLIAKSV